MKYSSSITLAKVNIDDCKDYVKAYRKEPNLASIDPEYRRKNYQIKLFDLFPSTRLQEITSNQNIQILDSKSSLLLHFFLPKVQQKASNIHSNSK
jgi:hypothetical protein